MSPTELAVAAEIARIAREELDLTAGAPASAAPLAEQLDSLQLLSLLVAVEDRFHVVLTDDEAARARTLADLARLVAERTPQDRLPSEGASP